MQDKTFLRELVESLQEWFDSACADICKKQNNLYIPLSLPVYIASTQGSLAVKVNILHKC